MKIKNLMDFLNKGQADSSSEPVVSGLDSAAAAAQSGDNIVYIENNRIETLESQSPGKELLDSGTQWADRSMGEILLSQRKLESADINRIIDYQREKGLYFGEAGIELGLVTQDDILKALSHQFGYSYGHDEEPSKDMVMATTPFGKVAEEFRSIHAQLLNNWLDPAHKTLAIVSPGAKEGRSYFATNIALAFSQLGRSTLLIDADLRTPRQHEIFKVTSRVGLSLLLAGRVKMEDLDMLPDNVTAFPSLSVLSAGPVPPNPSELLSNNKFPLILRRLEKYFDVIIIDTPAAAYYSDVLAIASVAGSALLVARREYSKMQDLKDLKGVLDKARATTVGAVLNQY